jgi:hypothetical protein
MDRGLGFKSGLMGQGAEVVYTTLAVVVEMRSRPHGVSLDVRCA